MLPDSQLARDVEKRPELFRWNGPEDRGRLRKWTAGFDGKIPEEMFLFWEATGGGEVFETETLLSPFGDSSAGEDIEGVTVSCRNRGLPENWMVFHIGWGVSAFDKKDGRFAWFEPQSYSPSRIIESFHDWYVSVLRAEFAERYGL